MAPNISICIFLSASLSAWLKAWMNMGLDKLRSNLTCLKLCMNKASTVRVLSSLGPDIFTCRLALLSPLAFFQTKESMAIEGSRSEEHTSELQSLMRISYADFCLKKKKQ